MILDIALIVVAVFGACYGTWNLKRYDDDKAVNITLLLICIGAFIMGTWGFIVDTQ